MTPVDHGVTLTPDARLAVPIDVKVMLRPAMRPGKSRIDQRASGARTAALRAAAPAIPAGAVHRTPPAGPHRPRPPGPQPAAMSPRPADEPSPSEAISTIEAAPTAAGSRPGSTAPAHVHANENYWRSSVKLDRIAVNDIVEVRVRGRHIVGRVTEIKDGVVYFNPICPGASWRHAKRARSSPTGARQEDSAAAREKPNSSRQLRPTGSYRWRKSQGEEPKRTDPDPPPPSIS